MELIRQELNASQFMIIKQLNTNLQSDGLWGNFYRKIAPFIFLKKEK